MALYRYQRMKNKQLFWLLILLVCLYFIVCFYVHQICHCIQNTSLYAT